jgi:hypothetical protein
MEGRSTPSAVSVRLRHFMMSSSEGMKPSVPDEQGLIWYNGWTISDILIDTNETM